MRPFQQFRLWARRAPIGERVGAAAVALIAVALVSWLLVSPSKDDSPSASANVEAANGAAGAGDAAGATASTVADGSTTSIAGTTGSGTGRVAGSGSRSSTGGGGRCVSPPGSDQGISEREVRIAMLLVDLAGPAANNTFNVPSADNQKADYEAVIDDINANGGVVCRKLVPVWFTINPLDQANLQQTCLDIAEAKVFYVNDLGGYAAFPALTDCYPQRQLPFFEGNMLPQSALDKGYPYMFAAASQDIEYFNAVHSLAQSGWFDPAKGFKKLGYLYRDCSPELPQKMQRWLRDVGVPASQIVTYNIGCPVAPTSPSDDANAVIKFQSSGVTNVLVSMAESDWTTFTGIAQRQSYKPRYAMPDQAISFSAYGSQPPDWNNADGTIVVTQYRFGEEHTPGYPRSSGTERCAEIVKARGRPDPYNEQIGMSGVACNQLAFFVAAIGNAPTLKRDALVAGLRASPPFDFSYPYGPATFPTPRTTHAGNFWRFLIARADCRCFRVPDPNFKPTFPGYDGP